MHAMLTKLSGVHNGKIKVSQYNDPGFIIKRSRLHKRKIQAS